ncbi:MAG: hypothetical protein BMS9Abin13_228 [Patescibacteria group bacterium]|nr:MAG: hypothetical protein BMS9Abin13_228 [Patescibacteria group bacterium]
MTYDLAIIGGGPAGAAAGVYAARKKLRTILIADEFGGQSKVSTDIQNWIGTVSITGAQLAENLRAHMEAYRDDTLDIKEGEKVSSIEKTDGGFALKTENGEYYDAKMVLVATGSHRRKITVPGAEEFENKGITYCASCDGPLFKDKNIVVIGGGNAGFETAAQLLAYVKSVTLLDRGEKFRADQVTVERVLSKQNMKALHDIELLEVKGEKTVNAIVYKNTKTGEQTELPTEGVFVEIGQVPTTEFVKDLVNTNQHNQIIIDPRTQRTSQEGIWAAGDNTDVLYHQNNIAVGDAVRAVEDIYLHLHIK